MNIGIVGCGWLGSRLAEYFSKDNEVFTTTTSIEKLEQLQAKGFNPRLVSFSDTPLAQQPNPWEMLNELNVVIITVAFSGKSLSLSSLQSKAQQLFSFLGNFKGQIFMMSTTSVYPEFDKTFVEEDCPVSSVLGENLIKEKFPQVNILRLAGLMGDNRLWSKYNVSNVAGAVNHIHYVDICRVIDNMISVNAESKIYNVVAPVHPSKAEVINAQKGIQSAVANDLKGKVISSEKMIAELNFEFQYPDPRLFHL